MSRRVLAIALCRVSSLEQLQNNSLKHQRDVVLKTAEILEAEIPKDGVWAGQVSSKVGFNYNRKDLKEMFEYCKNHSAVKYLVVSEVDRFMRSPDEQTYWYVKFWHECKVKVWFADKPELNADTHEASLFRYLEGWRAGGSNVERINKSINGQTAALQEGRYPFSPKPGYMKGSVSAIQEIHPIRGAALKKVLNRLADRLVTPTQALAELNESEFMSDHAPYKMDKFRKIVTDPFYAGIVEVDKQVKVHNENGLHETLITRAQHFSLIQIMEGKKKVQSGPRKNGNPKYAGNNITICDSCLHKKNGGRFVGFDHSNGKNKDRVYESYRCRSCGKYLSREELHKGIEKQFKKNPITDEGIKDFLEALKIVWKRREDQSEQESLRLEHKIISLKKLIQDQVEAATDPANAAIKSEILEAIDRKKSEVAALEGKIYELRSEKEANYENFLRYAYAFAEDMSQKFLSESISQENRLRCKQILFPAGFYVDENKKVYTPEKSLLITLLPTKKDAEASDISHLVRVKRL